MYRLVIGPACLAVGGRDPPLHQDNPKSLFEEWRVIVGGTLSSKLKSPLSCLPYLFLFVLH